MTLRNKHGEAQPEQRGCPYCKELFYFTDNTRYGGDSVDEQWKKERSGHGIGICDVYRPLARKR